MFTPKNFIIGKILAPTIAHIAQGVNFFLFFSLSDYKIFDKSTFYGFLFLCDDYFEYSFRIDLIKNPGPCNFLAEFCLSPSRQPVWLAMPRV